jgi:hypothetical protein
MWQTPFWNFIGLWVMVFLRPPLLPNDLRRFAWAWSLVFGTGLLIFVANEALAPYVTKYPKRTSFPGKSLSQHVIDTWHGRYHTPLRYVIGDMWTAGNVAWYADDRPHVFMEGDTHISPWIDTADLKSSGGVIVWCINCSLRPCDSTIPEKLHALFPQAENQEPLTLKRMTLADVSPVIVGWAIIPPENKPQ